MPDPDGRHALDDDDDDNDDNDSDEEHLKLCHENKGRRVAELYKLLKKYKLKPNFNARLHVTVKNLYSPPPPSPPVYETVPIETVKLLRSKPKREDSAKMREIVIPVSVLDQKCCAYWCDNSFNMSHLVDVKGEEISSFHTLDVLSGQRPGTFNPNHRDYVVSMSVNLHDYWTRGNAVMIPIAGFNQLELPAQAVFSDCLSQ
ncbi:hypothetical protein CYLTODRAFT_424579 [Cylindrobasidium torrendii FP15055 ss-10]|uniref:Uncharacterized protein n=1 Tax=Cylindrobasidium torrendii FP15055 ss-10 TaxID=1314674 RepID=A0A0D7B4V6_9AGAR|nr:hypothetical protein CYLTODRAFT_424579 [Cylindrobasidium torrendii FP15055 ss-10]